MDDEIDIVILIPVELNEVVAAAERTQSPLQLPRILELAEALQCLQIRKALDPSRMNLPPVGHELPDNLVKAGKINVHPAKSHRVHAAADIDADDVGDDLVPEVSCETDDAAGASMAVRHDPDLRFPEGLLVQKLCNLLPAGVLNMVRENPRRIVFSLYDLHSVLLSA